MHSRAIFSPGSSNRGHPPALPYPQKMQLPPAGAAIRLVTPLLQPFLMSSSMALLNADQTLQGIIIWARTVANCSPPLILSSASRALLCFSHRMWRTFTCVAGFNFAAPLHTDNMAEWCSVVSAL